MVAALGYAAWRSRQLSPDFGWSEARRGSGWQVAGVAPGGPAAGALQSGHALLALNGDAAVARGGTRVYRRTLRPGARYRMRVARGATTLEFELEIGARHRSRAVGLFSGLVWSSTALFIGFVRPQEGLARLAFAACTLTGLSFFGFLVLMPVYALQPVHVLAATNCAMAEHIVP